MSSVPRCGSDVPPGGLVDALGRAGCLVVTGMFDHEMHESVKGELASNTSIPRPQVADRLAPELRTMVGYTMHRALRSCVGADQTRRRKP